MNSLYILECLNHFLQLFRILLLINWKGVALDSMSCMPGKDAEVDAILAIRGI